MASCYVLQSARINMLLAFSPPISAFDQDRGLNALLRYDIISGNERHLFSLSPTNGSLFLTREIDLDAEKSLSGELFLLLLEIWKKPTKLLDVA